MSKKYGIDEDAGVVYVYAACPAEGDSILIVNCGDHFEVRHHSRVAPPADAVLTEEDIDKLKQGHITWH